MARAALALVIAALPQLAFLHAGAGAAPLACGGLAPTIVGTNRADYLLGTPGDDVIMGLDGDDTIRGLGGDDVICGGKGDDLLAGGLGADRLFGESGNEAIQASDPWVYCSTSDDGFATVSTAFRSAGDQGFTKCDPSAGPLASAVKVPDGSNKSLFITIPTPLPGANLVRDVNVRVFVTSPVVGSDPDPCALTMTMVSPSGVNNPLVSTGNCNSASASVRDFSGTSFDSEAIVNIKNLTTSTRDLNGRYHPSGSLDSKYRNKPVCDGSNCEWKLTVKDNKADGAFAYISWWALEINYGADAHDGADLVKCGYGPNDTLDYTARNAALTIDMADDQALYGQAGENDNVTVGGDMDNARCEWLYAGFGNDSLRGNSVYNDIRSQQGVDSIWGFGGNDRFRGGEGNDFQYGGVGDDKLDGNNGFDTLDGEAGWDRCLNGESLFNCESTR